MNAAAADVVAPDPGRLSPDPLQDYIKAAKDLPPISVSDWDELIWEFAESSSMAQSRAHKPKALTIIFSDLSTSSTRGLVGRASMRSPFVDFVKALVRRRAVRRGQLVTNHRILVIAARHLEATLTVAEVALLTRKHFELAQGSILGSMQKSTGYRVCNHLQEIADEIDEFKLTPRPLRFTHTVKRPSNGDGLDEESQRRGLEKMPHETAFEHLADISNSPADDNERILLLHVDLLVVCGFRIGECLTLPVDCWVEEEVVSADEGSKVTRCGLRYWPEKGGEPIVEWIPSAAVPLARRAVKDLTEVCRGA